MQKNRTWSDFLFLEEPTCSSGTQCFFSVWGPCSTTCGNGMRSRSYICASNGVPALDSMCPRASASTWGRLVAAAMGAAPNDGFRIWIKLVAGSEPSALWRAAEVRSRRMRQRRAMLDHASHTAGYPAGLFFFLAQSIIGSKGCLCNTSMSTLQRLWHVCVVAGFNLFGLVSGNWAVGYMLGDLWRWLDSTSKYPPHPS